jgi:hypothetical protein
MKAGTLNGVNLPPDVVAAAQERGRAHDLETTVAELWVELEGMVGEAQSTLGKDVND